ncbi:MAG: hypothetical protein OEO21_10700, partial [Candidatus Krumholzibacteria bacterium]|nr:hypothetical protein [Candidatus Krumholzibacteria bacterium]
MRAVVLFLSLLVAVAAVPAALAGPGSGSAAIAPALDVSAGAAGTWAVTYAAGEAFQSGTVRLVIPASWSAPQGASSGGAGYVTVATNEPTGTPSISSVVGQTITVTVDTLTAGNTITITYGDTGGGANPLAVATAPGAPGPYAFTVSSDPTGAAPVQIATSPSLDVVPGPPFRLSIAPGDTTITAGDFAAYTVYVVDAFGNRTDVAENRTVSLFPSSGAFFSPSDHVTPTTFVNIAANNDSARVDYMATLATTVVPHNLTMVTLDGKSPSLGDNATVSVTPAAVSATVSTISATSPVVADGVSQSSVTVTSRDAFGNLRPGDAVTLAATGSAIATDPAQPTGA